MAELDDRARSMAAWMGNQGAEVRIWEGCSRVLRGWCYAANSHAAAVGILVLRLGYGLKEGLHDDLELPYISSLMCFRRHQSPSLRNWRMPSIYNLKMATSTPCSFSTRPGREAEKTAKHALFDAT